MNNLCIYHGGCTDGVAAAWSVWVNATPKRFDFHAGAYSRPPPWALLDRLGPEAQLLLVDFSYKRPVMDEILSRYPSIDVVVLDHHASAQGELSELLENEKISGCFDMSKCGALLAWEYMTPSRAPELLTYIDARDRWDKQSVDADWDAVTAVTMWIRTYLPHRDELLTDQGFTKWSDAMDADILRPLREGRAIVDYYEQRVADEIARAQLVDIPGWERVPAVNTPYFMASDVAGRLADRSATGWAFCWWQNADGTYTASLRSSGAVRVDKIAEQYGGGGHPGAAGFECERPPWCMSVK